MNRRFFLQRKQPRVVQVDRFERLVLGEGACEGDDGPGFELRVSQIEADESFVFE